MTMKKTNKSPAGGRPWRLAALVSGLVALIWFLVRVIPKPSRAGYPCQRAAFPVASGFVLWLMGTFGIKVMGGRLARLWTGTRKPVAWAALATILAVAGWTLAIFTNQSAAQSKAAIVTDFHFIPAPSNQPVGTARGIFPGRVTWARDPQATHWAGHWQQTSDQWWLDENTDQTRVDAMLAATLTRLTGAANEEGAWKAIFEFYNQRARALEHRGYQPGEVVAIKINLNNSEHAVKADNYIDAAPQMVLAMVRELVRQAHVRPEDILIYDARRLIPPCILTKVWGEYKDVRFVQQKPAQPEQPKNPGYGDYHGLEGAQWVEGVDYSNGKYKDARLIPKQVFDATYIINQALLKAHSYPYNTMENGDEGQTGITMCGKNHFGSIKGTPELHPAINTDQEGKPNSYSPMVDLAASPHLGAKTILYVLDGLYSGRKWRSYPIHFPNPPFNNRVEPYENPDWPASVLASLDGVALDSVGLDILFAQTKNNNDAQGRPRVLIRANADNYLFEMAEAEHAPSGTVYRQNGAPVGSLGVHEHWDNDATMRYSRNLDPQNGKGIELIYLPLNGSAPLATHAPAETAAVPAPEQAPAAPAALPGNGLAAHDMFYAGEAKVEQMFIIRGGSIVWSYTHNGQGEISDATLLPSGNILFAHQHGITEITAAKQVVWNYDAPAGVEIHTAQPIGTDRLWFIENGNPAKFKLVNKTTGATEKEFTLPVANPGKIHGQFRRARLTAAGTLLVAHMDLGKVVEYDLNGQALWSVPVPGVWSVTPLANSNILVSSTRGFVAEMNRAGQTVWEFKASEAPACKLANLQTAVRLPNGNTLINNWFNQWGGKFDAGNPPIQAIEVTPDKQVVWALRSWTEPAALGPSTTIQVLN